ncbi:peptidoglycan recognition protein family protein [Actinotignum sp. GS-2025e]|uniref:peptidoglycan recognition protein family protein n=1 Tax=unclassified Actinotignum TaxID=2632702 RepID=UPI003F473BA8
MFHTNLADVLRAAGLTVVEIDGWRTRGYADGDDGGMGAIKQIVCHHTAGPATGDYPSLGIVRDGRTGLPGPLAQLGLGRSGTWYVIAAGYANHTGTVGDNYYGNNNSLGIEAENTGRGEPWPDVQYNSYVVGVRALIAAFGLPVTSVVGHKEIAVPHGRKIDPTFGMDEFRAAVAGNDITAPDVITLIREDLTTGGDTYYPLDKFNVDGVFGKWTVVALQEFLRDEGFYPADDYYTDGDFGTATITALQRLLARWGHYDREIDGQFGYWTIRGLQEFLQGNGYYKPEDFTVDGQFGNWTIRELQRHLGERTRKTN